MEVAVVMIGVSSLELIVIIALLVRRRHRVKNKILDNEEYRKLSIAKKPDEGERRKQNEQTSSAQHRPALTRQEGARSNGDGQGPDVSVGGQFGVQDTSVVGASDENYDYAQVPQRQSDVATHPSVHSSFVKEQPKAGSPAADDDTTNNDYENSFAGFHGIHEFDGERFSAENTSTPSGHDYMCFDPWWTGRGWLSRTTNVTWQGTVTVTPCLQIVCVFMCVRALVCVYVCLPQYTLNSSVTLHCKSYCYILAL